MKRPKPLSLIILDGFGHREDSEHNAINMANTPVIDELMAKHPNILVSGSGQDVGLPAAQMGNSEVGHMNLGAGRIIYQDLTRVDNAIADKSFAKNPALTALFEKILNKGAALHVMGLLSDGGVHSHQSHIHALIQAAAHAGIRKIYLHAFLDGRDTPPQSAKAYLEAAQAEFKPLGHGQIASICGRYFAMDRDNRWDRVEAAFNLIVNGQADFSAETAIEALEEAYHRGETDEFVQPTVICKSDADPKHVKAGDGIVFMNFRADRARELTHAMTDTQFDAFNRVAMPELSGFVTLTEYATDIQADVAFKPEVIHNTFAQILAQHHLKQLRIAETEKYAHVTFFFSCGVETEYPGETRILVPSPQVKTYDLKPEMSAPEVTDKLVEAIESQSTDVIICNFANPDMVGHTGNFQATVKAIETIDHCLGRILKAQEKVGGACLITADHGNAEQMFNPETGQPHTAHTTELVPLIYVGPKAHFTQKQGILSDIAPTLLYLLDLPIPSEMTGKTLLCLD